MSEAFYSREHQWVRLDGDEARIGITDYAQKTLGDVVYVELPAVGTGFAKGEQAAVVESVKTASEVYSPIAGMVSAVNTALNAEPELVNHDPEGEGWFFSLKTDSPPDYSGLMSAAAYAEYVKGLE
jgi:glycine cleavage system H protein